MSKSIFEIDYSNCEDTSREVKSNIYFLEELSSLNDNINSKISESGVLSAYFNWERYYSDRYEFKNHIKKETERYEAFKKRFDEFYLSIEGKDKNLKSLITNQIKFIEDNKNYDTYITILKFNEEDDYQQLLFDTLKKSGVPEDVALNTSILFHPETIKLLKELEGLSEEELNKRIKEIYDDPNKSMSEVILLEVLQVNKGTTYAGVVKDITDIVLKGTPAEYLASIYVGKDLRQYKLDIKSLQGNIDKIVRELGNSALSKKKVQIKTDILNNLTSIRDAKSAKLLKINKVKGNVGKGVNWLGYAIMAYQGIEVCVTQVNEVVEYGTEVDDALAAGVIDIGGIVLSIYAGAKIGTAAGTALGGPIGAVVGLGVGGIVGAVYNLIIDPILTVGYEKVIEPLIEIGADVQNDISDWWDTVWW